MEVNAGGDGSLWETGNIAVGYGVSGTLIIQYGGRVNSNDAYVSYGIISEDSQVTVDGFNGITNQPAMWALLGSLYVGQSAFGSKDGEGAAILWGAANTAHPTQLDVVDPAAGLCVIGHTYDGGVSLDDGGLLRCRNIQLAQAGLSGAGSLTVDGGMVRALDVLTVGQDGGGSGLVEMKNNALVATNGTYISPNGVITGTGTLAVNFLGLQNDGTLAPGINVLYPLASPETSQHQSATVTTMAISGTLTIGPASRLEIPLTSNGAGLYGSMAITGTATLDGILALNFKNGYAPSQGDTFTFWLTLASLIVPAGTSSVSQVADQITAAVRELNWLVESQTQFRQTLSQGIQCIMVRRLSPDSLTAGVFVRQTTKTTGRLSEYSTKAGRSWGFFLVRKSEGDTAQATAARQDVIELFLYQE